MAARVTLITINAVVDISGHVIVMEVGGIITAMTAGALENRVIIGIRMARRTHAIGVAVRRRELGVLRVVERCPGPGTRVVAVLARRWKELRLRRVPGVCRVVVIGLMTANAGRR